MKTSVLPLSVIIIGFMIFSACQRQQSNELQNFNKDSEEIQERVRPAASGGTTAAYFQYANPLNVADTLRSVSASFAGMSQVHESYETDDGMMGMREQKNVIILPGDTLTFKQGGLHIMLMKLSRELTAGDSVTIDMKLARAGMISKRLPVKP